MKCAWQQISPHGPAENCRHMPAAQLTGPVDARGQERWSAQRRRHCSWLSVPGCSGLPVWGRGVPGVMQRTRSPLVPKQEARRGPLPTHRISTVHTGGGTRPSVHICTPDGATSASPTTPNIGTSPRKYHTRTAPCFIAAGGLLSLHAAGTPLHAAGACDPVSPGGADGATGCLQAF